MSSDRRGRKQAWNLRHVAERNPEVDCGELLFKGRVVALYEAARDYDFLAGASKLVLERFFDCGFGFPDRGLEEGAGGDDDEVGRARVGGEGVSGLGQRAEDMLRVNLVLGTTEEDNTGGITNDEFLMSNQVPMA
jgi:hypothetical protein